MLKLAIIGYGEVGHIFARDLLATGQTGIAVYDILFDAADGAALREEARLNGVRPAASAADAAAGARLVISAVTADAVAAVAAEAAGYLKAGQIFLDVNSASPVTKKNAFAKVEPTGAHYVEGAVMQPVPGPDLKVPILGGGPHAQEAADLLNPLGMNITPVSTEPGRASAMKLCRSIMIKGIEALTVECMLTATHFGVQQRVLASLTETFPSLDWQHISGYMIERVVSHGRRRAEEMREVTETVRGTGLAPLMATATAERQQWMADLGAKEAVRAANGGKSSEDRELLVRVIRDCMT